MWKENFKWPTYKLRAIKSKNKINIRKGSLELFEMNNNIWKIVWNGVINKTSDWYTSMVSSANKQNICLLLSTNFTHTDKPINIDLYTSPSRWISHVQFFFKAMKTTKGCRNAFSVSYTIHLTTVNGFF